MTTPLDRTVELGRPAFIGPILRQHRRGAGDPTHRRVGPFWFRATRTAEGGTLAASIVSSRLLARIYRQLREQITGRADATSVAD